MNVTITPSWQGSTSLQSHGEDTASPAGEDDRLHVALQRAQYGALGASRRSIDPDVSASVCVLSPFEVHVSAEVGPQKVRAWGPGLETGMVGKSADFVVEAIGTEVGTLGTSSSSNPENTKAFQSDDPSLSSLRS